MNSGTPASTWPWRSGEPPASGPLPSDFFLSGADEVARALLGSRLRSTIGGHEVTGVVVETEAYVGPEDPACHAAERIGKTSRNRPMFGPPGTAYVFRSYGIHWCLNAVTGPEGFPAAVLLRAMDPVDGVPEMARRRGERALLASGPGRLGEALGVTGDLNGHRFQDPPLELLSGWPIPEHLIGVSGRIGIRQAADWPLRFYVRGHSQISGGVRE